ncbi:MAG: helix-turn-helix domain-containing protein [Peptococcaceae bacterium]|nr:helix-turn-helix domain-containing protein [Peptococcaceae bacterium]
MREYLGLGHVTAYNLLRTKGFPAFKVGNTWRISKHGLEEWIKKQSYISKTS